MGYIKAEDVLPEDVLALVQQYVDGEMLYIPRKGDKRGWGSRTHTRHELEIRNNQMYAEYQSGAAVSEIAEKYCLTKKSVQRIIRDLKTGGLA